MSNTPAISRRDLVTNASPTASYPSSNNINSILNHTTTLSPVIDPSLQSLIQRHPTASDSSPTETNTKKAEKPAEKVRDDHEMAALLRGIAEDHPTQRHEGSLVPNG
jgi:hypothetical protein